MEATTLYKSMELTNKQKITLVDAVGWETIARTLSQRDYANALNLYSNIDVQRKLGCSRYWLVCNIQNGTIPTPTVKILKKAYFTADEVAQSEKVWKSLSSENK